MDFKNEILTRHSVRKYLDKRLDEETILKLKNEIKKVNEESLLKLELVVNNDETFSNGKTHYGQFTNVSNYIVLIGKKKDEEKIGYFGEHLVLFAQSLGLNSCWVGLTFRKNKVPVTIKENYKMYGVITIGYGENNGHPHKSKPIHKLYSSPKELVPEWFLEGVKFSALAPTALNQQRFHFEYLGENKVKAISYIGFFTKVDLGIVKYHFEVGANKKINWKK